MTEQITQSLQDLSNITTLLKQHDINPTAQRLEIARILFSRPQHLSADQVLKAINTYNTSVSKATVYNTLNLFAEKRLLRQVIVDPSRIFYDSNTGVHYHFYNEDTGELRDLDPEQLKFHEMPEIPEDTYKCGIDVIVHLKNK